MRDDEAGSDQALVPAAARVVVRRGGGPVPARAPRVPAVGGGVAGAAPGQKGARPRGGHGQADPFTGRGRAHRHRGRAFAGDARAAGGRCSRRRGARRDRRADTARRRQRGRGRRGPRLALVRRRARGSGDRPGPRARRDPVAGLEHARRGRAVGGHARCHHASALEAGYRREPGGRRAVRVGRAHGGALAATGDQAGNHRPGRVPQLRDHPDRPGAERATGRGDGTARRPPRTERTGRDRDALRHPLHQAEPGRISRPRPGCSGGGRRSRPGPGRSPMPARRRRRA